MTPHRNSKLNGFERKTEENVCFSLETIEFTVALRPHLYFASAALLGRAGLGQGWRPLAVSELGLFVGWAGRAAGGPAAWAGPGLAASGWGWHAGCAGDCQRAGGRWAWQVGSSAGLGKRLVSSRWAGCLPCRGTAVGR